MSQISVPVSFGELLDKMTILEIKQNHMTDADKLANVRHEYEVLNAIWKQHVEENSKVTTTRAELKAVNQALWDIEDDIRVKESRREFDEEFIRLARAVYYTNDDRARLKKELNMALGSDIVEEKSYQSYE